MKTILVPTDFSKHANYGLEFAANLARKSKAKLHLFNVAQAPGYYFAGEPLEIAQNAAVMMSGVDENMKKASLKRLEALKSNKILKGINVTVCCNTALNVHYEILDYSDKIKADVIIMGSKGSSGVAGILLGSTSERVVRFSERPVIVIPTKIKNPNLKLIVFASDFEEEAYGIFPVIRDFAKIFKAGIELLKVNTRDQFSRTLDSIELMNKFIKRFGGKYKTAIYNDYMKEEGILRYANETGADMITIGTHGKKGIKRFFGEDVSAGIVRLSLKPVLVVNMKKFKNKSDLRS